MRLSVFTDETQLADRRHLEVGETLGPLFLGHLALDPTFRTNAAAVDLQEVGLSQFSFVGRVVKVTLGADLVEMNSTRLVLDCGIPIRLYHHTRNMFLVEPLDHKQRLIATGDVLAGIVQLQAEISYMNVSQDEYEELSVPCRLESIDLLELQPEPTRVARRRVEVFQQGETARYGQILGALLGFLTEG